MAEQTPPYQSNPFILAFNALGRFFNTNPMWAITLIILEVINFMMQAVSNLIQLAAGNNSTTHTPSTSSSVEPISTNALGATEIIAIIIIVLVIVLIVFAIASIVGTYITGMFSYVALKSEAGKRVSFSEAFMAVSQRFWRLYLAQTLAWLKIFGWFLLLIIPGIVATLRYILLPYVIMDEPATETGITNSHNRVKTIVKGRLWEIFGVSTVSGIVPFIGPILGYAGRGAQYRQLQIYTDQKLAKPKIHWLNYLGVIFLGAILLLAALIILLVLAFNEMGG